MFCAAQNPARGARLFADFRIQRFSFRFGLKHNQKRKQERLQPAWPGLSPGIHVFLSSASKTWMPGTKAGHDDWSGRGVSARAAA
jgi:hypothetical protein